MEYARWEEIEEDVGCEYRYYDDIDNNYRFLKYFILTDFHPFVSSMILNGRIKCLISIMIHLTL